MEKFHLSGVVAVTFPSGARRKRALGVISPSTPVRYLSQRNAPLQKTAEMATVVDGLAAEAEILAEFRATTVVFTRPKQRPDNPRRNALRHTGARGFTGARLRVEARRLMAEERRAGIYQPETRPPVLVLRVNGESSRESRPSRRQRGTATSPRGSRASPGGEAEPPLPRRTCAYCGRGLEHKPGQAKYCSASHRVMACRARARAEQAKKVGVPEHEQRVVDEITAGRLAPWDGILCVLFPADSRRRWMDNPAAEEAAEDSRRRWKAHKLAA